MLTDDEVVYLSRVVELATAAASRGETPFAALLVAGGRVLAESCNQTVHESNPTAHAEMVAIRVACSSLGTDSLIGATAFCSCEPCAMCLMAFYYAGVKKVVFAATIDDARDNGSGDPPIGSKWLAEQGELGIEIVAGPLQQQAADLLNRYRASFGHL